MPPVLVPLEGPFSRSVREALESVASPEAAKRVIEEALARARRTTIPEDTAPFAAFVQGVLRATIAETLGPEALEIVGERLAHVQRMAESQVVAVSARETVLPPGAAQSSAHEPDEWAHQWGDDSSVRISARALQARVATAHAPRVVLALTLDPLLVVDTQASLPGSRVLSISSMNDLLAQILAASSATRRERIAIVIDTALPSIDVPTVASLATAIPEDALVVLWGMSDRQKERLVAMFPVTRRWIASGTTGSIDDLLC